MQKIAGLACAILLAVGLPASAANPADPVPHYVRAGAGFACVTNQADFEKGEKEQRDMCLRVGPLFVGMARKDAEAILGKPVTDMPSEGRTAYAYRLQDDATGLMVTYVVLIYGDEDRADVVQVTGKPWSGNWQFCGLTLGSPASAVTARMGEVLGTQKSELLGTIVWEYKPWTFSFEIAGDAVTSIRLAK